MVVFPNAKINLGLNVVCRRPDGYHDIETVMIPVRWQDVLEIVPAAGEETTLTVTGREVNCPPEKNLVMKAYRAVAEKYPEMGPVDIFLHKIIPDGAGLGGGSADAAFTIIALNELRSLGMTPEEMASLSATIGSDCPFFIYNRPMLCTSTGTVMHPFELAEIKSGTLLAIVKPPQGVSTAAAYAGVTPRIAEPAVREIAARPVEEWRGKLVNDFEPSVISACPAVGIVKEKLESLEPVYCSMSGSGSAVFAFYSADNLSAEILKKSLSVLCTDCEIYVEVIG